MSLHEFTVVYSEFTVFCSEFLIYGVQLKFSITTSFEFAENLDIHFLADSERLFPMSTK